MTVRLIIDRPNAVTEPGPHILRLSLQMVLRPWKRLQIKAKLTGGSAGIVKYYAEKPGRDMIWRSGCIRACNLVLVKYAD